MSARERVAARGIARARVAAIGCLVGVAVTHAVEVGPKFDEAPYLGVLFSLAIAGSLLLAAAMATARPPRLAWTAAGGLAAALMIGYFVSRTAGVPQLGSHVGHWRDAAGIASLVFEAVLIGLASVRARPLALRLAPAAVFLAFGVLGGAATAGQVGGHDGHSGHSGTASAGGAGTTDHGAAGHTGAKGAGGEAHPPGHVNDPFPLASPGQRAELREHLARARETARTKFPTFEAARAAGYVFAPRSFDKQKDYDYWHLSRTGYMSDSNYVDPTMPETLMYWKNPSGKPQLLAFVYRVPRSEPNPPLGGPIVSWHLHTSNGRLGKLKMTHVWLVDGVRDSFQHEVPRQVLERERGLELPKDGTGAGV
jgi:hypothetical protein